MLKKDLILKHLKRYGSITKSRAADLYKVYNLGDTIFQLKGKGYKIETRMIPRVKKNSFAKYCWVGV